MYLWASKRICIEVENHASGTTYSLKSEECLYWSWDFMEFVLCGNTIDFFFSSFSWSVLVLPITMAMKIRLNFCVLFQRNCITLLMAQPVNPVKKQRWVTGHWTKEMVLNWVGLTSHDRSTSVLDRHLIVLFSPFSWLIMIPCPLYEGL